VTFEQYARRRLPLMLGTARAMCGDAGLAEDLVQDVLIKLHARWAMISALDAPDAYVRRMLVNEFISWRRKWSRLIPHVNPSLLRSGYRGGEDDPATMHAVRDALFREIRRLPARQRVVIGLRYFADLSDDQIAEALGCSRSTVRVHAARALAALRISHAEPQMKTTDGELS
jgi:RNA polymerase sigma-70 factor (sigma-E family)